MHCRHFSNNTTNSALIVENSKKIHRTTSILPQKSRCSQGRKFKKIQHLISTHSLTDALDSLEKSGISGDFALFMIQNIQLLEV